MFIKNPVSTCAGLTAAALLLCLSPAATLPLRADRADSRPNIVLIIGDDISIDDHGVYGHPSIRTPNVDRLAANGLRLTHAYVTIASCSPSRASIITGRYPHNTGAPELHMPLPEGQVLFPLLLRESGYYTAAMGKWHLGESTRAAFDAIGDSRPAGAELWVKTLRERPPEQPFFMWFAAHDAHRGWEPDPGAPPHAPADAVVPPYMVDAPATREDLARYMDEVQRLDRYVGEVVAELDRQGVLDNTLLLYMSDNGRPFPRDKAGPYEGGIRTPFIVHWPDGLKEPGMVSESLLSAIDIAPTLLEVAGVEVPETVQGISFRPLFDDPEHTVRDYVFTELNWHTQFYHSRTVRWEDYVLIRNATPELSAMMGAKIDRHYPAWLDLVRLRQEDALTPAQQNNFIVPRPAEELFDLKLDPHQLTNLVNEPEHRRALMHLQKILDRWQEETGDTIPDPASRTPDRHDRETGAPTGAPFSPPRVDYPGKARNAETINEPGPRSTGDHGRPTLQAL